MKKQNGSVLLVSLAFLIVLTLVAVVGYRMLINETRFSTTKAESDEKITYLNSALREAEFRIYGQSFIEQKINPKPQDVDRACKNSYKVSHVLGSNAPCSIIINSQADINSYFANPSVRSNKYPWFEFTGQRSANYKYFYNSYFINQGAEVDNLNPEYGDSLSGRGTYYFLVNARLTESNKDALIMQSTVSNYFMGIKQ